MTTTQPQPPTPGWQLKAFPLFTLLGWALILISFLIGLFVLTPTAAAYWGSNSKAVRDAAEAGSALLAQLQTLGVTPRWLEPLTFVGVASFMLGIALEFSTIPAVLKNRGQVISAAFPLIVKLDSGGNKRSLPTEEKSPFPFNMVEGMMPMFPMIAVMGWMLVLIYLLIGAFALSPAQATFFSDAKAVREGASAGSAFVQANVASHVIEAWVPQFKFLGLGLGLLAIMMALGTIAKRLRRMGQVISNHMPVELRPATPPIPGRVRVFQLSAMMGVMILLAALIIGIALAAGVVPAYWNHSIASELNPAEPGSALLGQLGIVSSYAAWLDPLRMVGMAFLFTGITIALTVIIGALRLQANILVNFYQQASRRS